MLCCHPSEGRSTRRVIILSQLRRQTLVTGVEKDDAHIDALDADERAERLVVEREPSDSSSPSASR
jgi:hypothetical protein